MFNSPFELNTFRKKFDKIIARNKAMHSKLESSLFYNPPPPFTGSYKKIQRSKRPIFLMEKNNWMRRTQNGDKIVTNFNKIQDVSKFSKKIRSIHTPKNNNLHCYFKTQAKEQKNSNNGNGRKEVFVKIDDSDNNNKKYIYNYLENKVKKQFEITEYDLKTLESDQLINDTIINFFLKFIEHDLIQKSIREKTYFFSTYFMTKLLPSEADLRFTRMEIIEMIHRKYGDIKKWIKTDIFSRDFLVLPIHKHCTEHWSVIIVCFSSLMQNYFGNEDKQSCKFPYILYFDSLGVLDDQILLAVKCFLIKEFGEKKIKGFSIGAYSDYCSRINLNAYQILAPRQNNFTDCGLFLLSYVELFLNNPGEIIVPNKKPALEKLDWFPQKLISEKRNAIRKIIEKVKDNKKALAIFEYKSQVNEIMKIPKSQMSEYERFDPDNFNKYLRDQSQSRLKKDIHTLKLEFFLNTSNPLLL